VNKGKKRMIELKRKQELEEGRGCDAEEGSGREEGKRDW
jgi:hypothetical protein